MNLFIVYWFVVAVMVVGVIGAVIPAIPGPSLILGAILIWCIATNFTGLGWWLVVVVGLLIVSTLVEILATYWGAQRFGASKWGQFGAIIGMVVGFLGLLPALPFGGPLLGILLGPVLGAAVAEFIYRRDLELIERLKFSLKIGLAIVVGSLLGNVIEGILAAVSVGIFIFVTWPMVMAL